MFLLAILCALSTLLRRSHCADGVFKEHHSISVLTPRTTTAFSQRPLCAPAELLMHCRRLYRASMATLRRPHCALIRTPSHGVRFEHAQSAPSFGFPCGYLTAFTGDATVLLRRCLRSYYAHLGVLHFSWTPWDRRESAALCDSGLNEFHFNNII